MNVAYHKLCLLVHPDRVSPDERDIATERFKVLSRVHRLLVNPRAKHLYDNKGILDDESQPKKTNDMELLKRKFVGKPFQDNNLNLSITCNTYYLCSNNLTVEHFLNRL